MGFKTCGPNKAIVKTGLGLSEPKIIHGGYCFVWPCIQEISLLDLRLMTLEITSPLVYTKQGVPISVNSIAQVKIDSKPESLKLAARNFLGKTLREIGTAADHTLEGHQRAIVGTLSVEEVFQNRESFASEVSRVAAQDLEEMGPALGRACA
ncbi:flotillin [Fonticula alba]|uniref:Flotillin n=1 Tax=Fonticula alba TaxID=691883 RepID=A0A058Z9K2_FONAL|nr:flotillin [Fonticula alba]KCV70950.1 flotillin [Fonticula alba]|eukprot:XP_009494073.1 flotillin [Fonticula alba]